MMLAQCCQLLLLRNCDTSAYTTSTCYALCLFTFKHLVPKVYTTCKNMVTCLVAGDFSASDILQYIQGALLTETAVARARRLVLHIVVLLVVVAFYFLSGAAVCVASELMRYCSEVCDTNDLPVFTDSKAALSQHAHMQYTLHKLV
jgi:hypothetical protein